MCFIRLFLFFLVTSPTLSSVVSDEMCHTESSPEGLSGRCKRQASPLQCVLPRYPEHGSYTVGNINDATPGQAHSFLYLNITCYPGFIVKGGSNSIYCYNGLWSGAMPKCVRFCRLSKHASVTYFCPVADSAGRSRECGPVVPSGTIVKPVCKAPNYYHPGTLEYMICSGGNWNRVVTCTPDCGKITPEATLLISGGKTAQRGELPWHAGIYSKSTTPYKQICGGSLVSTTIIISAAHCFWSDSNKLLPASLYAVAVGKIYRPWSNPMDTDAQTSDVSEIKITQYFKGEATNYQDDIALVIVVTPFTYQVFVRPVCLDFDEDFDKQQLNDSNLGKVAGWGLVDKNGNSSQVLKVVELPFVNVEKCYALSPHSFREFITNDKICAGYTNGTALCQGDSGGGLAFPAEERGVRRYFLRGVVSTAPRNQDLCSTNALTAFTRISKHERFIKNHIYVTTLELSSDASGDDVCLSSQWQCDENRCIELGQKCDGNLDCFDGSDEVDCTQMQFECVFPPQPEHGSYTVSGDAHATPGQAYRSLTLNVTCDPGFIVENGKSSVFCLNGAWSDVMPKCIRVCRLDKHDSVEYRCNVAGSAGNPKECGPLVPVGTIVLPKCRAPLYYYSGVLNHMRCIDGIWNYVAICKPECGRVTPEGMPLVSGGKTAYRGELPWHAGIYSKTTTPYMQICGGSLINVRTVLTAAICFWKDASKLQPAANYAVAVGKIYRKWSNPDDPDAQKSDVERIVVPQRFQGAAANFQDDIAVVIVETPFTYHVFVRPVCLDFDPAFEKQQLRVDSLGKVAGWGLVSEDGKASPQLKVAELPYISIEQCISTSPPSFREYITSDKICAGYTNGTAALCHGDSGGGLVFPASEGNAQRYYLRGIASTAPASEQYCNTAAISAFTQITRHEHFIKDNIIILTECVLPPQPEHGSYHSYVPNDAVILDQGRPNLALNITCDPGFMVENEKNVLFCLDGEWSDVMPKCVRVCRLDKHDSVEYRCNVAGSAGTPKECGPLVPVGTIVVPKCRAPLYYYSGVLNHMRCIDGIWNYVAICKPECGRVTPEGMPLVSGGKTAYRGELPWHAGIYSKTTTPYMQICGGSLINVRTVLTAAICFWKDASKLQPAANYAVAVGKIYRKWSHPDDPDAQKSDVERIVVPQRFQGAAANFQDDIAVVIVATPFTYHVFVRPVCLDFDPTFEKQQLRVDNLGKVAGWGLVSEDGKASPQLKVAELPYISIEQCISTSPPSFREYITSDKICAGYTNGTAALCHGDSGGGLVFPASEGNAQRYYLRGIASTAPASEQYCNTAAISAFTQITRHEHFIKDNIIILTECVLPPQPEHGSYHSYVPNDAVILDQGRPNLALNITCDPGFMVENEKNVLFCLDGEWSDVMPKCVRVCRLDKHDSVEYRCNVAGSAGNPKECGPLVPVGTIVVPKCRAPLYYYSGVLNHMRCIDGIWNYVAICKPECGRVTPEGMPLISGGKTAYRGELPWNAGIYIKTSTPYMQICGGSLISVKTVITGAICFWKDTSKLQPAANYAVAVGKIYRKWSHPEDPDAQKSDVERIVVPQRFQGAAANFQDDIAVVIVATPFTYHVFVRPVCLDFDPTFEKQQLRDNNLGKVAGWGLVSEDGKPSPELKVAEIPYISIVRCISMFPPSFREYITSDKICAGYTNGTAVCRGDSGAGLVFPAIDAGTQRYYLRGLVSTAPTSEQHICNTASIAAFTSITKHEHFIKENII